MIKVEKIVLETDDPQLIEERINSVVGDRKVLGIGAYIGAPIYILVGENKFERRRRLELFIFFEEG